MPLADANGSPAMASAVEIGCVSLDELPDYVLSFLLSFLHAFLVAGSPNAVNSRLGTACRNPRLCRHVLARDLAAEEAVPLPRQPLRRRSPDVQQQPRVLLEISDLREPQNSGGCDHHDLFEDAAAKLRSAVRSLCGMTTAQVAQVAARDGHPYLLAWAAQRAPLNNIEDGMSALMIAARNNRLATLAVAAAHCDLDQEHRQYGCALHMAAFVGAAAAAEELCQRGASLETVNKTFKMTPLHVAASRNHTEVVRILLDARADHTTVDRDGMTAMRIAEYMRSREAEETLREYTMREFLQGAQV